MLMEASWMKMTNIKDQSKMSTMKKIYKMYKRKESLCSKAKRKVKLP